MAAKLLPEMPDIRGYSLSVVLPDKISGYQFIYVWYLESGNLYHHVVERKNEPVSEWYKIERKNN